MRFNPSSNKYTDLALQTFLKLAMEDYQQEQKQAQAMKMLEQAKSMGLFGDMGGADQGQGQYYIKNPMATDISDMIGMYSPDEMRKQGFQNRVTPYMGAKRSLQGLTRDKWISATPEQKSSFIKARETYKTGLPEFGKRTFVQGESGKFKEISGNQAVIDPQTGEIVYNRPKGAVFQPRGNEATDKQTIDLAIKLAQAEGSGFADEQAIKDKIPVAQKMLTGKSSFIKPSGNQYTADQEKIITDNMKAYGKTREEIIKALIRKGLL